MSTLPSGETKLHRVLRLAHLWMGAGLIVPLVALGLSGTILTFDEQISDLTKAESYVVTSRGDTRSLGEMLAVAQSRAPESATPFMITIPEDAEDPTLVRFQRRGMQGPSAIHQVLLDPVTLEIFTSEPFSNGGFMRVMHQLHGNLLMDGGTGRPIVGYLGIVMCLLGVSGLIMWWPKTKQSIAAAFMVTRGVKGFRLHRELHGAVGIWTWIVFIVVSFSGVYIAFPQATGDIIRVAFPARDMRVSPTAYRVEPVRDSQPIGIDDAAALALATSPDARVWTARFPARPDQPYRFSLIRSGHEHGQPAVQVAVDPWKKAVIEVLDPKDFTIGETIMAWQRGLHAGDGAGWIWRILVGFSGLLPLIFGITGIAMWLNRRRVRRRATQQTVTEGVRS